MTMIEADAATGFTAGLAQVPLALSALRHRLLGLIDRLDAEAWDHRSRCELWTVHDVIRHVRDAARLHVRSLHRVEGSELAQPFDPRRTPRLWLERTAGESPDETITELRDLCDEEAAVLCERLEERSDDIITGPYGRVHWTILTTHVFWDAWVHIRDVAEPLGLDAPSTAAEDDVVALYALLAASVPALLMRRPLEARVILSTADGHRRAASVSPGRVTLRRGGAAAREDLRGELAPVVDALAGRGPELAAVLHGVPASREPLRWTGPILAGKQS